MDLETKTCVLETDGSVLTVRKFPKGLQLCAQDIQGEENAPVVHTWRRVRNFKIQMAFRFQRGDDLYLLKVEGTDLKVEKILRGKLTPLTESHWFERKSLNGSMQYSLQSVVDPDQCLSLNGRRFILSKDDALPAPIRERTVA